MAAAAATVFAGQPPEAAVAVSAGQCPVAAGPLGADKSASPGSGCRSRRVTASGDQWPEAAGPFGMDRLEALDPDAVAAAVVQTCGPARQELQGQQRAQLKGQQRKPASRFPLACVQMQQGLMARTGQHPSDPGAATVRAVC